MILLPEELTAENGAKALLIGEFTETIETLNPDYCECGICSFCRDNPNSPEYIDQEVYVSWTTIKNIYAKIVKHYRQ